MFNAISRWLYNLLGGHKDNSSELNIARISEKLPRSEPIVTSVEHGDRYDNARTQWEFGDWAKLASLQRAEIENQPKRANLALLAAAGRLQVGAELEAVEFITLAKQWGASANLISEVLIAGVYNTLGRAAVLNGSHGLAVEYFKNSVESSTLGGDARLISKARTYLQLEQLSFTKYNDKSLQISIAPNFELQYLKHNNKLNKKPEDEANGGENCAKKLKDFTSSCPSAVILSTQRSGSTLLCDYLAQKGFGKPDEHILNFISDGNLEAFEKNESEYFSERFNMDEYIGMCTHDGVFSTKIMVNHIGQISKAIFGLKEDGENIYKYKLFSDVISNSQLLVLRRRDVLKQALSRHFAGNTGVCHEIAGENFYFQGVENLDPNVKRSVIYSFRQIENHISRINSENALLNIISEFLRSRGCDVIDLIYEDFVSSGYCNKKIDDALKSQFSMYGRVNLDRTFQPSLKVNSGKYSNYMEMIHKKIKNTYTNDMSDLELMAVIITSINDLNSLDPPWFEMQASFISEKGYL